MPGNWDTNRLGAITPSVAQQGNNKFMNRETTTITYTDKNGNVQSRTSDSRTMSWSWGAVDYSDVKFYQVN